MSDVDTHHSDQRRGVELWSIAALAPAAETLGGGGMMKTFVFAALLAVEINSCSDPHVKEDMLINSRKAEKACRDLAGVPIYTANHDVGTATYFQTVTNCILQPVMRLTPGEKP